MVKQYETKMQILGENVDTTISWKVAKSKRVEKDEIEEERFEGLELYICPIHLCEMQPALHCTSQMYFSNVFLNCISQVYFSSVFLKCISQVYFTSVFLKCISQMYFSTVLFMCISSCAQLISAKCSSSPTQQCTATPIFSCNLDCAQILLDYSSVWKLNEYSFGYVSLFLWLHIHLSLFHLRFCLCSFYVISMVPIMFRPSVLCNTLSLGIESAQTPKCTLVNLSL